MQSLLAVTKLARSSLCSADNKLSDMRRNALQRRTEIANEISSARMQCQSFALAFSLKAKPSTVVTSLSHAFVSLRRFQNSECDHGTPHNCQMCPSISLQRRQISPTKFKTPKKLQSSQNSKLNAAMIPRSELGKTSSER
jgi:hypothetical protein